MGKPWENGGFMGFYGGFMEVDGMYPLVMTNIANWKIIIEIVDLPIINRDFP